MQQLEELIERDLDYIVRKAGEELERLSGSHVWFTGGAGFLGYYFTLAVRHWNRTRSADARIRLTILDNFIRGVPKWLSELDAPEIRTYRHDVTAPIPEDLADAEWIVHGASIASPTYYRKHPLETIDANVNGLRRMLDYAAARRLANSEAFRGMLFFSTSEIYGDPPAAGRLGHGFTIRCGSTTSWSL